MVDSVGKIPSPHPLIIGIGASAGGLEPLSSFLSSLPREFNFVLVFLQHLSARHKNLLPELLRSRWPDLAIIEVADALPVLPGRLYLSPPGKEVRLHKRTFQVAPREKAGHIHFPIDEFFLSLAAEAGERAIAVIFSGAGTDGIRGLQAVRSAGGTVFVQDPETAEFASMPVAAINTGQVDAVLPPTDMVREILKIGGGAAAGKPENFIAPAEFETVFRLLQEKTGSRFHHYKKSVVSRRIKRRMYLHGVASVRDYLEMVQGRDAEAALLAADLMIGVTSFFRDRVAWRALRIEVVTKLTAENVLSPIRVWAPACATGEEAYSIAMMLHHELALAGKQREIQVFATDVNERALEKAREGKYAGTIVADVPPDFIRKYFTCFADGQSVSISKEIREQVIFAKQDILSDPPFSRLDAVICRNLLIYLEPEAQTRCLALFHYALKEGGYLFLGNAESVGRNNALFKTIGHQKCRIYRKIETLPVFGLPFSVPLTAAERTAALPARPGAAAEQHPSVHEFVQSVLLDEFAPAAVAFDQNYSILYHNGPTNRYLHQPRGTPTRNLFELLPQNLHNRIRGALYRAGQGAKTIAVRASIAGEAGRKSQVALHISQLRENLFLLVFREKGGFPEQASAVPLENTAVEETALWQLESELDATRQDLRKHIEQLRTLNEELQSSNEELQAANEEFETSREELQSLNEELTTVNSQLQSKIEEQEETNNDLNNFLASTSIPTLFLDEEFRMKRFTPAMVRLIKLLPSDTGRPIIDMSQEHLGPELITDARAVLDLLVPVKREITIDGAWYVRSTLPYRTSDNRIEGVVVTYTDISDQKRDEERVRHLASFPELNPNPVLEVSAAGQVTFCNPATHRILANLGMDQEDVAAFLPPDMAAIMNNWNGQNASSLRREVAIGDRVYGCTIHLTPQFTTARIYAYDITRRKRAEAVLRESQERLLLALEIGGIGIFDYDLIAGTVDWDARCRSIMGLPEGTRDPNAAWKLVHPEDRPALEETMIQILDPAKRTSSASEYRLLHPDGEVRWIAVQRRAVFNEAVLPPQAVQLRGVVQDITGRKQVEEEREIAADFLRLVNESRTKEELIKRTASFFQSHSRCEAVGIRLKEGDDYPYYETRGFPPEFVRLENFLCAHDEKGEPRRNSAGYPIMECMCGNVIQGRYDPAQPFFTARGSFWTNCSTELLATTTEADRQARTRNRCNGEGYESVALLAIRAGSAPVGLLQLNDRRRGRFTAERIALWERLSGYLGVALDKLQAEADLARAKEELEQTVRERTAQVVEQARILESFFQHTQTSLVFLDREFNFIRVNEAYARACGRQMEDFAGHNHFTDYPSGELQAQFERVISTKKPCQIYGRPFVFPDHPEWGVSYWDLTVAPISGDNGAVEMLIFTLRDVTDRTLAEKELTRHRLHLEELVQERTAKLENANREMESFIYSVSHDLHTPLRSVGTFAKLIAKGYADRLDARGKDYFRRVMEASSRMDRIIDDLLHLSRVSRYELVRTPVDLSALAATIIAELRESSPGRQVKIDIQANITAVADQRLISLALVNLLGNAWKFTSRTKEAAIVFGAGEQNGATVYYLRDNGAGFSAEYAEKIFQPFQRLHSTDEFEGTGIGLAIVELAIRRHGGKIWAQGERGQGATISFTLTGTTDYP